MPKDRYILALIFEKDVIENLTILAEREIKCGKIFVTIKLYKYN